jgi:hypothetical protein
MGILEIILTVTAYRKGWKAIALIPIGVALAIGFMSGAAIKAQGGSPHSASAAAFAGDLLCLAILAFLNSRAPKAQAISHDKGQVDIEQPKLA